MSLASRIVHLERSIPRRRCLVCRGWPRTRVTYIGDAQEGQEPAIPERCPSCGWEPLTIRVEYVDGDGWRQPE